MVRRRRSNPHQFGLDDDECVGWEFIEAAPITYGLGSRRRQKRNRFVAAERVNDVCNGLYAGHEHDHIPRFFEKARPNISFLEKSLEWRNDAA